MRNLIPVIIIVVLIVSFFSYKKIKRLTTIYEKKLLTKCLGDKSKVERLISYELKRNPNLSREDAARNANASITRDNR